MKCSAAGGEKNVMIGRGKKKPSRSPSPPGSGSGTVTKTSKNAALVAASDAIEKTHTDALARQNRDRLQQLRGKIADAKLRLKRKAYREMRKGDPKRAAKKARYVVLQKNFIDWQREYEALKRELDYESPAVDMSDSSEDEMNDNTAGRGGNKSANDNHDIVV